MNEKGSKRREWVKTAAIIFLSIMLVLTFFSNTIMNYSLPEVATQYVQSGTITAKIRGSGTVESGDPYNVEVKESRKVASVAVRVGDQVQKGDVIYYLEDEESEELKKAQEALKAAEDAYKKALLSTDLTASDIEAANAGATTEGYRQQITTKQNAIKAAEKAITAAETAVTEAENDVEEAQKKVDDIQEWHDAFDVQIQIEEIKKMDTSAAEKALETAKAELEQAKNLKAEWEKALQSKKEEVERIEGELAAAGRNKEEDEAWQAAMNEYNNYKAEYDNAVRYEADKQEAVNRAEEALNIDGVIANLKKQQAEVGLELRDAKKVVAEKQEIVEQRKEEVTRKQEELADRKTELAELQSSIGRVMDLQSYRDAIDKAQEEVDKQSKSTMGATITAPISGTINSLAVTAGKTTTPGTPVAVMQPEGQGYTMSFTVTNEQAKRLSVGDMADLNNSWRYGDMTVVLASIKVDTNNPGQNKLLNFDVTGSSVVAGQTLSVSVGQKSANYDYIVPNSAIREDNNGKFVLIVKSKSSPLGTRYYAERVDVEVIASDDTQSAVSGAINNYDYVITTSTKPVEAGNLVRLND